MTQDRRTDVALTRRSDADYYPNTGGIIYEPAFFEALSAETEDRPLRACGLELPELACRRRLQRDQRVDELRLRVHLGLAAAFAQAAATLSDEYGDA
jgi:hypothetical protein